MFCKAFLCAGSGISCWGHRVVGCRNDFGFVALITSLTGMQTVALVFTSWRNNCFFVSVIERLGELGLIRISAGTGTKGVSLLFAGGGDDLLVDPVSRGGSEVGLIRIVAIIALPKNVSLFFTGRGNACGFSLFMGAFGFVAGKENEGKDE